MKITYRGANGIIEAEVVSVQTIYTVKTPDGKTMIVNEKSVITKEE